MTRRAPGYLVPAALDVLLFVNLDWWESLWVATRRPTMWVFAYSAGRLIARLVVVVCVAVVTNSVAAIIGFCWWYAVHRVLISPQACESVSSRRAASAISSTLATA